MYNRIFCGESDLQQKQEKWSEDAQMLKDRIGAKRKEYQSKSESVEGERMNEITELEQQVKDLKRRLDRAQADMDFEHEPPLPAPVISLC